MFWMTGLLGLLISVAVALQALAVWRAWVFIHRSRIPLERGGKSKPAVSLLVPVCGLEGQGLEDFQRFCRLDWPFYQVIFTVLEPADPAIPVLRTIASTSACEVSLQIGGTATGANRKIRNLRNAFPQARHDWIVLCDADVRAEPSFFEGLLAPLLQSDPERGDVGLVHSLYRCLEEKSLASSWEHVWINCDFWAQGLLGEWLRGTDFAFGAAMALHRDTLRQVGGLEALQDFLADDYQLGNRVAKLGKELVFNSNFVTLQSAPQSWRGVWDHLLRWSRTIRVCQPGGFAGSILTNVTLFALLGAAMNPTVLWPLSVGAIGLRIAGANQCRNWITHRRGLWNRWWLIPFKDLVQTLLWFLAFRNAPVEWRGQRYHLGRDGRLSPMESGRTGVFGEANKTPE